MLTDDQLIQEIRWRLHAELSDLNPPDGFLDRLWADVDTHKGAGKPARRAGRRFGDLGTIFGLGLAVVVVGLVALAGLGLLRANLHPLKHQTAAGPAASEQPLSRILAVLRRPQTKADLPPALLRVLDRSGPSRFGGRPDLAGVRLAAVTPAGEQVFLVPFKPPSVSTYLSRLPKRFRGGAHPGLTREARAQAAQGDQLEIQLLSHGQDVGAAGLSTSNARMIEREGTKTFARGYKANSVEVILVVPDGVAKVTVITPSQDGSMAFTRVTGVVHNNVSVVLLPAPVENPAHNMIWYGPTGHVIRRIGDTNPTTPPPASSVRAPITVRVIKAHRYCNKPLAFGGFEIPCDHGIPHGYKPAPWMSRSLALVDISFTAQLAADNHHSVYEYSYARSSGPASCTLNTGGTAGTTMVPIRAGQRVTIQDDQEVCPGTFGGVITYQPNGGPGQDTLNYGRPIRDGSVLVGRFSYVIR